MATRAKTEGLLENVTMNLVAPNFRHVSQSTCQKNRARFRTHTPSNCHHVGQAMHPIEKLQQDHVQGWMSAYFHSLNPEGNPTDKGGGQWVFPRRIQLKNGPRR